MTERTREEHLAWCKQRALEYLDNGDLPNAFASMMSDLKKHPDFGVADHLGMLGLMCVANNDREGVRQFIEGFR